MMMSRVTLSSAVQMFCEQALECTGIYNHQRSIGGAVRSPTLALLSSRGTDWAAQCVNLPFTAVTRSVLDVFLLSDALYNSHVNPCCTVETCDYSSHHRRVCLGTRIPRYKAAAQYRTASNWRVFNTESFLSDIAKVDWSSVLKGLSGFFSKMLELFSGRCRWRWLTATTKGLFSQNCLTCKYQPFKVDPAASRYFCEQLASTLRYPYIPLT